MKQRHDSWRFFLNPAGGTRHLRAMDGCTLHRLLGRNWLTALFAAAAFCLVGIQCSDNGGSGMARLKETGIMRVGTDATYPPFESVDTETSEIVGFDIDIIQEICRELRCAPEFIVTPFDGIVTGLSTGKYDVIASAFTITPERAAQVSFTTPYYDAGQALAIPIYDTSITGVTGLSGKSVGVQLGTTGERLAAGIEGVQVISFENIGAAFIDMENGRLDAVINDRPTTEILIRQRGSAKIVGPTLTAENYGFAVRLHDRELLEAVNHALEVISSDGRYKMIRDRWFGEGG